MPHQGEGAGVLMHLRHIEGQGYYVHLAAQLHTLHCAGVYRDTVLHCKDGSVTLNRLFTGLLYPGLADIMVCRLPDKLDLILTGVGVDELKVKVAKLFDVNGANDVGHQMKDSDENEASDNDGAFESELVKTELTECSPDIDVNIDVKEECESEEVTTSSPKYKWSCFICKETFRRADQLAAHALEQHDTDRPYHCSYCQFTSREKGQLLRHENTHTRAHQVSCDICGKSFLDARDLNNHKTVHSDVRNMKCEHCDKMFKSDLYLKRHIKLMHSNTPGGEFKCEICQKIFKTKDYLNRHDRKVHGEPRYYVCSFCGKNFKSPSHRKDHEEIHRGEANAECEVCGTEVRKKNLERHMKTHSDAADFQCDICAKPLKTVEAFRAHMNSHELPFKCEYCERAFSTKYSMKSHTVQQHLLKKESDSSKSKVHKPMTKCDQCDYQCSTSRYMKTHKAVKHDGLLHKCDVCQFTTGDLGSLRSHRRAKHEGVVYSCDQCEFKSGYKNNLKNHKAVAHFTVDGCNVLLQHGSNSKLEEAVVPQSYDGNSQRAHWMDNG